MFLAAVSSPLLPLSQQMHEIGHNLGLAHANENGEWLSCFCSEEIHHFATKANSLISQLTPIHSFW